MFTGRVATAVGRGCWVIEMDETRDCIWVHQRYVVREKFLHINDRVRFRIVPHCRPKRPDDVMAADVEIIGLTVARQTNGPVAGGSR